MRRRATRRILTSGLAAILLVAVMPPLQAGAEDNPTPASMLEKYDVKVIIVTEAMTETQGMTPDGTTAPIRIEPADKARIDYGMPTILREFDLYPPELVDKVGLRRIVLGVNLTRAGTECGGMSNPQYHSFFLVFPYVRGDLKYTQKSIHHEFFHMLERGLLKDAAKQLRSEWAALNPSTFHYSSGAWHYLAEHKDDKTSDVKEYPFVLTQYSTSAAEEDRAEVFACLMASPAIVQARCDRDTVIEAKADYMKQYMRQYCPQIDDKFWREIARKRAAENQQPK